MERFIITGKAIYGGKEYKGFYTGFSFQKQNPKEFAKIETAEKHINIIKEKPYNFGTVTDIKIVKIIVSDKEIKRRKDSKEFFKKIKNKVSVKEAIKQHKGK